MHTAIFPIKFKGFSKFFTILGLITSTAFTKSCTSVPIEATKLSRQWFLVEFENYPKEFFRKIKSSWIYLLQKTILTSQVLTAVTDCISTHKQKIEVK